MVPRRWHRSRFGDVTMSYSKESFPMLDIIPNPNSNSFTVFLRSGANSEVECVGEVVGIRWNMEGPNPGWTMAHSRTRVEKKPKLPGLPMGYPSKIQLIDAVAFHYYNDKEFTAQEIFNTIKELYPTYPILTAGIAQHLRRTKKKFSRRLVGKVRLWKCVIPTMN